MPDVVILYLYENDYESLPHEVFNLAGKKFIIRLVREDIRSYKKLIPALHDYPDAVIVTADDDVRYRSSWLRELVEEYNPKSKEVLGHRAHRIRSDSEGNILPYSAWDHRVKTTHCSEPELFLTGVGGILYPPGTFTRDVFDTDVFMSLCGSADDIWFYFMARRNGFVCRKIGEARKDYYWKDSQEVALCNQNLEGRENDIAIANMIRRFGTP